MLTWESNICFSFVLFFLLYFVLVLFYCLFKYLFLCNFIVFYPNEDDEI